MNKFFFGAEQSNLCVCAPGEESQCFGGSHSLTLMAYVSAINFMLQFRVFVFVGANVCVELRMISSAEDLKFFFLLVELGHFYFPSGCRFAFC